MISNQILQNTIEGLKAIARVDFGVMDTDGKEAASTTQGWQHAGRRQWNLPNHRLIPRRSRDFSILRFMMINSRNMY